MGYLKMASKWTEHDHQCDFLQWFRWNFKGVLIYATLGGARVHGPKEASKLKAEGMVAGIPDLHIPAWGLWVEMKRPGGRLSSEQVQIIAYLQSVGQKVLIGYGSDDAKAKIKGSLGDVMGVSNV